ncbi:hypothetical protein VBS19_25815 [Klebsiella pneumoniae]|nr:hypothetical protein [Klebsiella pneumoniae]
MCLLILTLIALAFLISIFRNSPLITDIQNIFRYKSDAPPPKTPAEPINPAEESANRIQFFCQRLIFAALTIFLLVKGGVEIIDTLHPNFLSDHKFLTHIKEIKTLSYVAKALAVSCGFQLAFMLITKGPDEAVEPIMLGIASVILLMLSVIAPEKWSVQNSLSVTMLIACIAGLFYLSRKLKK